MSTIIDNSYTYNILKQQSLNSSDAYDRYQTKNLFNSDTLQELMSDEYDYRGPNERTIYVKNRETGEPAEATVRFKAGADTETFLIYDRKGSLIGKKDINYDYETPLQSTRLSSLFHTADSHWLSISQM